MTFVYVERATTTADPAAVWALWSDPGTWPGWDPAVESLEIVFEQGATGTMRLAGGIETPVVLDVVEAGRRWVDRLTMGELVIVIDHVVETTADGSALTVTTTIDGPGADDIGPMVTHDAPVALAALTALAEAR